MHVDQGGRYSIDMEFIIDNPRQEAKVWKEPLLEQRVAVDDLPKKRSLLSILHPAIAAVSRDFGL